MRRFLPILLSVTLAAQQAPVPPASQTEEPTFRADTRLVVQQVTVKDKDGKPIEGLTAKHFVVTEDGVTQTLAFVDFQQLAEVAPAPVLTTAVIPIPRLSHSAIAAEKPLDLKYNDRRLLAHELTHVEQYRRLGIAAFATQSFARDAAISVAEFPKVRPISKIAGDASLKTAGGREFDVIEFGTQTKAPEPPFRFLIQGGQIGRAHV